MEAIGERTCQTRQALVDFERITGMAMGQVSRRRSPRSWWRQIYLWWLKRKYGGLGALAQNEPGACYSLEHTFALTVDTILAIVNAPLLNTLPIPAIPQDKVEALSEMSRRIQGIETHRILQSQCGRSRLTPESQPIQNTIDKVLFCCYGLSEDDAQYIEQRLTEML